MKKLFSIILMTVVLLNMFAFTACAETADSARNSNYFNSYGANLSNRGDGKIKIVFSASGTGICDSLGVATYEVDKRNSSGNWEDVTGLLNGKTASGVSSYSFSKYFYGVEGETYRVKATFISTINGSSETKSYTSGSITA